jgi:hypothetical protein
MKIRHIGYCNQKNSSPVYTAFNKGITKKNPRVKTLFNITIQQIMNLIFANISSSFEEYQKNKI